MIAFSELAALLQAVFCIKEAFANRPILEVAQTQCPDAAHTPHPCLQITLRNPLQRELYLEDLTLIFRVHRKAFHNPILAEISLPQISRQSRAPFTAPDDGYLHILRGKAPIKPGARLRLGVFLATLYRHLPPESLNPQTLLRLSAAASFQDGVTLNRRPLLVKPAEWGEEPLPNTDRSRIY